MKHIPMLPQLAALREALGYSPSTGIFTWLVASGRCRRGSVAGCIRRDGYRIIRYQGVGYRANRLAFLFVEGREPEGQIDHIDGERDNNRWNNLRDVTNAENCWAIRRKPRGTASKYQGVGKKKHRWRARIRLLRKEIHLGYFDTEQEARGAYLEAQARLHKIPIPRRSSPD